MELLTVYETQLTYNAQIESNNNAQQLGGVKT